MQAPSLQPGQAVQWAGTNTSMPYPYNGISGTYPYPVQQNELVPWEEQLKAMKEEISKDIDERFSELHFKLDKMNEILQSLVKVDTPIDEIRKALGEDTFNRVD